MSTIKMLIQIITLLVMIYILVLILKIDESREKRLNEINKNLTTIDNQLEIDIVTIEVVE